MYGAEIGEAFRRVVQRPWLWAALVVTNLGLVVLMTAPLSSALAMVVDLRPAATAMIRGDDGLLIELLADHVALFAIATVAIGAGLVLYGLLSWVLDGGVLSALALDGERRAQGSEVLGASGRLAGRMIVIGLYGLVLRVIPLVFGGIAFAVARVAIKQRTFQPSVTVALIALAVAAFAWAATSIAIDYARGLALDDGKTRSWRLLGRGLKLLWTRRSATAQLVALTLVAWLAVDVGLFVVAGHVTFMPLLTLLRLLALVARVAITMTMMTAAARLARAP